MTIQGTLGNNTNHPFPVVLWMVTVISLCAVDGHCYFLVFSRWLVLFPVVLWMVGVIS